MLFSPKTALTLNAFAVLGFTAAFPLVAHAQDVITFDSFVNPPPQNGLSPLANANGNSSTYDGVTFSSNAYVVGSQFAPNGVTLASPHSGDYAFTSGATQNTTLLTTKTLDGLYLGQVGAANTAASVTVNALGAYNAATGSYAVLGSTTDALTSTTLSFFDTSSLTAFASLLTFNGYSLVSQGAAGTTTNFDFAGDDFTFGPPTQSIVTGKFDFDTDSVGTGPNPGNVHTQFSDSSHGITATFSSPNDSPASGNFGIFTGAGPTTPGFSGNALVELDGRNTPLFVAFDQTLNQGSVAFNDNGSNGQGVFSVQELLNGVAVGGPVTSSTFGTVSFGGTAFNSLIFSDTNTQFAIDNLDVSGSAPVPEASTTVSFGLLLALGMSGIVVAARKKKAAAAA
ncbi:MAG: hypothetical protein ACRYFS_15475 [Janthinobacterium lividum]